MGKQKSGVFEEGWGSKKGSGAEQNISLTRAPLHKIHFPVGMGRAVQEDAPPLPEHLLLQFNDVIADVSHHQQEEVEGAGRSLKTTGTGGGGGGASEEMITCHLSLQV